MDAILFTPCQRLKKETQALHCALDKNSTMRRLLSTELTRHEYALLLRRMWNAYRVVELALDDFRYNYPGAAHWAMRSVYQRTPDIEHDLKALGMNLDGRAMTHIERSSNLQVRNEAQAIGCMYVLGGSMAGARIVERFLTSHFGEPIAPALNFFGMKHSENALNFSTLQSKINRALNKPKDLEEAIAKAQDVFYVFIQAFTH